MWLIRPIYRDTVRELGARSDDNDDDDYGE